MLLLVACSEALKVGGGGGRDWRLACAVGSVVFVQSVAGVGQLQTRGARWGPQRPDKMWRLCLRLVAVAALCLCTLAQAQSDLFQFADKRNTNKYCGRNLANMLQLVCNGNYYPMFKKSSQDVDDMNDSGFWIQSQPVQEPQLQFPFRSRTSASLIPDSFRRRTRGVYDECCRKSCTVQEMASYCGRR
ncbi:LIRP-like isoform X2 [Periplaneta americana]|uniref:LIRP-like isoform X2 n=1 Tax=Periplaneta americana TaxID=6978 RepID=UPI0037E7F293